MTSESSGEKAKVPNVCLFHDISTVKVSESSEIMVMYPFWHIIVDEASGTKISGFYKAKNSMVKTMCEHIHNMTEKG